MAESALTGPPGRVRFVARPPWWGPDLQTLRSHLRRPPALPAEGEPIAFPLADGDVLTGRLDHPGNAAGRPLLLLVHGLTGCERSRYMLATAHHFTRLGYPVLRLNLRGAGPSRDRCRRRYHAGLSEDLREALLQLDGRLVRNGLLLAGFSLGGNLVLKLLAELGRRAPVLAAASISAPIDLKATQRNLERWRNLLYHRRLLRWMKAEAASHPEGLSAAERALLPGIASIYEFDEKLVAPRHGFAGADDYYARSSAGPLLGAVAVPTLVIHALDDPWIPGAIYRQVDWAANPKLHPLLPRGGGHVGFHAWDGVPAHDRWMSEFFAANRRR
ncbi:MAG: alpha/beta fold hydrolase [Dongiaceae bacterium]